MKTFDGKTITKKHIVEILKTMDSTKVYALVHKIYGGKVTGDQVYNFICQFATTEKVLKSAHFVAYNKKHMYSLAKYDRYDFDFEMKNMKHRILEFFKEQIKDVRSPYAKRPMMGHTHLYFCSPVYGHSDYNKWRALPIKGNERFCELICNVADKYFVKH